MDQNLIFEASPSRENELLQKLFWTKKGTPAAGAPRTTNDTTIFQEWIFPACQLLDSTKNCLIT